MSDITTTFLVLAAVVAVFIWDRVPVAIVALGTAVALWATGVLDLRQAVAGFGDPTVLFIAALFVVAEALDASGVTAWAGQQLLAGAGENRVRVLVFMLVLVALVTALITVNASVAALMPVVVVMAVRLRWPPSQLLMPLAFGAHAGSLLALTGTPVNVIVAEAAADAGVEAIGFFEFAYVGLPLVIGTIGIVVLFGERLLPTRSATAISRDFSNHAATLTAQYGVTYAPGTLLTRTSGVAEVVIPPRSGLLGQRAFPGMVTESGDLVVLAMQRKGEDLAGENTLTVGDTLLLQGTWVALDRHLSDPDVVVIDHPELFRRQAVPFGPGAGRALAALAGMVVLLITGVVPGAIAAVLAAMAVVLMGVLSTEQAFRSIAWNTIVLVGGMMAPLDGDDRDGRGDLDGQRPARPGRRRGAVCAADGALRPDRRARPVDQQHGDGAHRDPDRAVCGHRDGDLAEGGPHVDRRDVRSRAPDASGHPGKPDGHGAGRLQIRRLLETGPAAAPVLRSRGSAARARVLAVLT
jgi:di/tricarboxylate transporter